MPGFWNKHKWLVVKITALLSLCLVSFGIGFSSCTHTDKTKPGPPPRFVHVEDVRFESINSTDTVRGAVWLDTETGIQYLQTKGRNREGWTRLWEANEQPQTQPDGN